MSRAGSLLACLPGKRLVVEASLRQVFHDASRVTPERVSEYLAAVRRPGTFPALRSLGASLGARPGAVARALSRIQARTLVLWGGDDRWIPLADASRFVAAIPGSRKLVIPDCGHVPQEEKPDEVARLLLEFLAESPQARGPATAAACGQRWPRLTSVSRALAATGLCGYSRTMTSKVATPSARRPDET
jgi:pimeloyl-ACP methyl ester carboxylesterase